MLIVESISSGSRRESSFDYLQENWKFHIIGERGQLLGREDTLVCYFDGQEPQTLTFQQ